MALLVAIPGLPATAASAPPLDAAPLAAAPSPPKSAGGAIRALFVGVDKYLYSRARLETADLKQGPDRASCSPFPSRVHSTGRLLYHADGLGTAITTDQHIEAGEVRTVFISYARADRARVKPLAAALAAAGHDVWWDALIDGGAAFAKTIEQRLAGASVIVVVWSANSVASDWVRDEAGHARDRKRLIPITIHSGHGDLGEPDLQIGN